MSSGDQPGAVSAAMRGRSGRIGFPATSTTCRSGSLLWMFDDFAHRLTIVNATSRGISQLSLPRTSPGELAAGQGVVWLGYPSILRSSCDSRVRRVTASRVESRLAAPFGEFLWRQLAGFDWTWCPFARGVPPSLEALATTPTGIAQLPRGSLGRGMQQLRTGVVVGIGVVPQPPHARQTCWPFTPRPLHFGQRFFGFFGIVR